MTPKEQVIEWLVANEATTIEIIEETNARSIEPPSCFRDEARTQWYEQVEAGIVNEITRAYGMSYEDAREALEGYLKVYVDHVLTK